MNARRDGTNAGRWRRPERLDPLARRVRERVTVDTRALAAFRVALGVTLLVDLLHRSLHLRQFYTDDGVYPLAAFEATFTQYNGLSVHALSGALWYQQLLFVVAGLLAVALILGYRTRLVGLFSLLLLFSLHGRNPAVLNGGDRLLRVLLLVSLVAPLGERWSVDALRRGSARRQVATVGTAALLIQPVAVFTANAAQKHGGTTWYAGDGLEVALSNDTMSILLGDVLVEYPAVLTVLTYAWVVLLAGSAVFLLLTTGRARALAALAYVGAFAGMALTISVGLFPLALTVSVLPFLTTPFWDGLARRVPANWTARLPTAARLGPLGRPPIERLLLDRLQTRDAALASQVRDAARLLMTALGFVALVWILLFSALDATGRDVSGAAGPIDQQEWGLYTPDPPDAYDWYVVEASLADGTTVDARDGERVTFDRPAEAAAEYETFRHRKYLQAVRDSGASDPPGAIARHYAAWACERATAYGDVERVTVYRMEQSISLGGVREEQHRWTVVSRDCRGG